jgi:hypothetical protein
MNDSLISLLLRQMRGGQSQGPMGGQPSGMGASAPGMGSPANPMMNPSPPMSQNQNPFMLDPQMQAQANTQGQYQLHPILQELARRFGLLGMMRNQSNDTVNQISGL